MKSKQGVSKAQLEVLEHTVHRAAREMFCAHIADPVMNQLLAEGLMRDCGRAGFLAPGEHYYTVTPAGRALVEDSRREK